MVNNGAFDRAVDALDIKVMCFCISLPTQDSQFRVVDPEQSQSTGPAHSPVLRSTERSRSHFLPVPTMMYNLQRYETLCRFGIEQLPLLQVTTHPEGVHHPFGGRISDANLPVRMMPVSLGNDLGMCPSLIQFRCRVVNVPLALQRARLSGSFLESDAPSVVPKSTKRSCRDQSQLTSDISDIT